MPKEATLKPAKRLRLISPVKMKTSDMLEQRHMLKLAWAEPWPACGPEGNAIDAHIELRATVHDCINLSRAVAKAAGRPTMGDDENHLLEFLAVHWAVPVLPETQLPPQPKP